MSLEVEIYAVRFRNGYEYASYAIHTACDLFILLNIMMLSRKYLIYFIIYPKFSVTDTRFKFGVQTVQL
jgi:hypothetical protein